MSAAAEAGLPPLSTAPGRHDVQKPRRFGDVTHGPTGVRIRTDIFRGLCPLGVRWRRVARGDTYGVQGIKLEAGSLVLYPPPVFTGRAHHAGCAWRRSWIKSMVQDAQRSCFDLTWRSSASRRTGRTIRPGAAHGRVSQPAAHGDALVPGSEDHEYYPVHPAGFGRTLATAAQSADPPRVEVTFGDLSKFTDYRVDHVNQKEREGWR